MEAITINGLDENDFRRSIEAMLRNGEADDAAAKLRTLLTPYCGPEKRLPERFLTVSPEEVSLAGWQDLRARIGQYDRPEHLISALRIAITDPDPEAPALAANPSGRLSPLVETSYFSDTSFPFSEADRNDLLDGYSMDDSAWQGDFEAADSAVKVEGIDDLYGAVAAIEARVMSNAEPESDDIRAGSLAACFLAVLVHQAVRHTAQTAGLPRALCVLAGNDGVYPYFDAPVLARDEYPDDGATRPMPLKLSPASSGPDEVDPDETVEGPYDFSRLSSGAKRKARKTPVLMLDAAEADLASHQYEAGAATQLADADATDRGGLLPTHDAAELPLPSLEALEQAHKGRTDLAKADALPETQPPVVPDHALIAEGGSIPFVKPATKEAATTEPTQDEVLAEPPDVPHAASAMTEPASEPIIELVTEPMSEPKPKLAMEPSTTSTVRSLRARLTVEPEPQPSLLDRLMAVVKSLFG